MKTVVSAVQKSGSGESPSYFSFILSLHLRKETQNIQGGEKEEIEWTFPHPNYIFIF